MLEEEKRMQNLLKLVEQTPYFDAIQNATSKLDELTAAAKGHEYFKSDELDYRGHLPMNGFTDQKIIRDTRLKLANALRAAGIIHTDAAREVINRFHPRPELQIHGIL